jgi:heme O synthase-like polyprenyltransferase
MSADGSAPTGLTIDELRAHGDAGGVADFVELLKPRVMSLVVFTGDRKSVV